MQTVQVTEFGGPDVLRPVEVPDLVAGEGQVLVAVEVIDTIFVETQIRAGKAQDYFPQRPPYVPGNGAAGTVVSVGAGVDHGWIGRRVLTNVDGAYAEQVVAPVEALIVVPDGLGLREAAALVHDGRTALAVSDPVRVEPGEWVLVLAAAGGLGILLVQLARAAGGRVVAAARGERKLELARSLGAEVLVDYTEPDWAEQVQAQTGGPAVVFDGVGGQIGLSAFEVMADGGRFSAHGAASGGFASIDRERARQRGITVRGIEQAQLGPAEAARTIARVLLEAEAGRVRPVIDRTFPLTEAAAAHAAIAAREVAGKALLLVERNGSAGKEGNR